MALRALLVAFLLLPAAALAQPAPTGTPVQHVIVDSLPAGGAGLTDAELRATPVPVSGSVTFLNTSLAVTHANFANLDAALSTLASQATLALIKAKTDNIDVLLSTRTKPADAQHAIIDSGNVTFTNATIGLSGTLPAFAAIPTFKIDQTTPGATNRVDIGVFPDNEPINVAQFAGTNASTGTGAGGSGIPRVTVSNDSALAQRPGSAVSLSVLCALANIDACGANSTAEIQVDGYQSATVRLASGTLAATMVFDASYNGTNWSANTIVVNLATGAKVGSVAFTNPNAATVMSFLIPSGAVKVRVRLGAYTSGSATATGYASTNIDPFVLAFSAQLAGSAPAPEYPIMIGGLDSGGLARTAAFRNARPAASDYGLNVRPFMPSNGTQDLPTADAPARTLYAALNDGVDTTNVTADGSAQVEPPRVNIVNFGGQESVAAPLAGVWYIRKQWALPASAHFTPGTSYATVTTALTKTLIGIGNSLGTLNVGTNAFAAVNSVASPFFYSRLFGCVTTVLSATPDTITPTYTDELGNSQATAGVVFAASAATGNCYEFPLAASALSSGQDVGVRAVTTATDSAATTGIVTFYGVNPIADFAGTANGQTELIDSSRFGELNANEQIFIFMQQAVTTAQLKTFGLSGTLR